MIRKLSALIALLLSLSIIESKAAISFNVQADLLQDAAGNPMSANGLVLFIVSTSDLTFGPIVEGADRSAAGSPLGPGSDDYVAFRSTTLGSGLDGVFDRATGNLNLANIPGWNPGDPLAIVWFPTIVNASSSLLSAGTPYGFYTDPIGKDTSRPWITPADPSSAVGLLFYTTNSSGNLGNPPGTNPAITGRPSQSVLPVPEPTTFGLFGLGIAGLMARRRRK